MAKTNSNLAHAKYNSNDEFYTQYETIENELLFYVKQFENKIVYCNCDNYNKSNFYKFFKNNYSKWKLKKVICTFFTGEENSLWECNNNSILNKIEFENGKEIKSYLNFNGDFQNDECIEILKSADIIVTNPPFSLFQKWIEIVQSYNKQFIVLGNMNAVTSKEIFPYICHNKMWLGMSLNGTHCEFIVPDDYTDNYTYVDSDGVRKSQVNNCVWFTNMENEKHNSFLPLTKIYEQNVYEKYDKYDAINVNKIADIPKDYYKEMGVPITYLIKHNPKQFQIMGILANTKVTDTNFGVPEINGKRIYSRIIIKRADV